MTNTINLLLVLFFAYSPVYAADINDYIAVDIPKTRIPAPEFTIIQEGKPVSLSQYGGKLTILNFWSLECQPCRDEMNSLDSLAENNYDKGLRVLAISIGDDPDRIKQFKKRKNYSIIFLVDEARELRKKYKINAIPITYIIGRDGKFVARFVGARNWADADIKRFIESII